MKRRLLADHLNGRRHQSKRRKPMRRQYRIVAPIRASPVLPRLECPISADIDAREAREYTSILRRPVSAEVLKRQLGRPTSQDLHAPSKVMHDRVTVPLNEYSIHICSA